MYLFASCYYRALSMNLHSIINSPLSVIEKKKTSTIILFTVIVNFFFSNHFENKLECFEIDPRCHQTAGENISYQIFLVPLCFALSLVSHVLWGLLAPLCRPKTPDLSDQDTKITWPYLQVVSLTNLNR